MVESNVRIVLEPNRSCARGPCDENAERLSNRLEMTVKGPEPLTGSFVEVPESHSGSGRVVLRVQFSDAVSTRLPALRDHSFQVTNGNVRKVRRVDRRSDLLEVKIKPSSDADIVVVLPPTTDCEATGAVCTRDGRRLSNQLEATVKGP